VTCNMIQLGGAVTFSGIRAIGLLKAKITSMMLSYVLHVVCYLLNAKCLIVLCYLLNAECLIVLCLIGGIKGNPYVNSICI